MDMYSNFYPQPAPIHHMNAVPTHIQAGYPATNGYGVPTRVPPPPNSNQRRMDNRQNFQSDQNSSKTLWMGNVCFFFANQCAMCNHILLCGDDLEPFLI